MMNKIRSARLHLLKFLFILPLMGVLLVAFRNQVMARQEPSVPVKAVVLGIEGMKVDGTVAAVAPVKVVRSGKEWVVEPVKVGKVLGLMRVAARPVAVQADTTAPLPRNVLYVIDGEVVKETTPPSLDPSKIYAIDVMKGAEALRLFGEKGKNGVVVITTKAFKERYPEVGVKVKEEGRAGARVGDTIVRLGVRVEDKIIRLGKDSAAAKPLIIVDGIEMKGGMEDINPENIESISVIKDAAAGAIYGEKGKNGVIIIQLKKKPVGDAKPVSARTIGKDGYVKGSNKDDFQLKYKLDLKYEKTEEPVD